MRRPDTAAGRGAGQRQPGRRIRPRATRARLNRLTATRLASRQTMPASTTSRQSCSPVRQDITRNIGRRSFAFREKPSRSGVYFALCARHELDPSNGERPGGEMPAGPRPRRRRVNDWFTVAPRPGPACRPGSRECRRRCRDNSAVVLLADIAEMRGEHDVVDLAQRVVERQRLDVEHVEAGARDLLLAAARRAAPARRRSARARC